MPLSPTPNMGLVLPVITGDPNAWGGYLNDAMSLRLDVHDHAAGNGVRVPTAGMRWDANVNLNDAGTTRGFLDCRALGLASITPTDAATFGACVFRNSSDGGNFYLRTAAGQLVRINNGAALDVSAAGGFGGDYSAVGADARFDDGTDAYWFRQQLGSSVNQYARIRASDYDFYEFKAHPAAAPPTNRVRIASPAALAASIQLTLPPALPGTNGTLIQSTTAGVLTLSSSGLAALSLASGAGITLAGAGGITLSTGVISTGGNISLTGSAELKHGTRTLDLAPFGGQGPTTITYSSISEAMSSGGAGLFWNMPLPMKIGDRILAVRFYFQRAGGTLTFEVRKKTLSTGLAAGVASTTVSSGTAYATATLSAVNYTLVSTEGYCLRWTTGASGDLLFHVQVDYDRP